MNNNDLQELKQMFISIKKTAEKMEKLLHEHGVSTENKDSERIMLVEFASQYLTPCRVPLKIDTIGSQVVSTPLYQSIRGVNYEQTVNNLRRVLRDMNIKKRRYSEGYRYYVEVRGSQQREKEVTQEKRADIYHYIQNNFTHSLEFMTSKDICSRLRHTDIGKHTRTPRQIGQYLRQWSVDGKYFKKSRVNGQYGYFLSIK